MAETDSFIDEVSEEVRKDQLFGYYKRYGWIVLLIVLAVVGGAAFNEWQKASVRSANEKTGDAILVALEQSTAGERAVALSDIVPENADTQALVKIQEANMLLEDGRIDESVAVFQTLAEAPDISAIYKDLARLRLVILSPDDAATPELIENLATVGRPFRLLAIEQRALAHVRSNNVDAALADLKLILEDPLITQDLRERSQQLTVVLGGELPQTPSLLPVSGNG